MYTGLLHTHNLLRWIVIIVAVIVLFKSYRGWFGNKDWSKSDKMAGIIFTSVIDIQFLIGIVLYTFYSPIVKIAFNDFGAAMKNADQRFFAVEHITLMIIALILVHIGKANSKKGITSVKKHRTAAIYYTIAIILIMFAIPWERALI